MSAIENPPAFPLAVPTGFQFAYDGMTLRDWFAGQALAGIVANSSTPDLLIGFGFKGSKEALAEYAYAAADAMLTARSTFNDADNQREEGK